MGEQYVKQIGPMKWCKGALAGCHCVVGGFAVAGSKRNLSFIVHYEQAGLNNILALQASVAFN